MDLLTIVLLSAARLPPYLQTQTQIYAARQFPRACLNRAASRRLSSLCIQQVELEDINIAITIDDHQSWSESQRVQDDSDEFEDCEQDDTEVAALETAVCAYTLQRV